MDYRSAIPDPVSPLIPHFLVGTLSPKLDLYLLSLFQHLCLLEAEEKRIPAVHAKGWPFWQYRQLALPVQATREITGETVDDNILLGSESSKGVSPKRLLQFSLAFLLAGLGFTDRVGEFPHFFGWEVRIVVPIVYCVVNLPHFRVNFAMHILVGNRLYIRHVISGYANGLRQNVPALFISYFSAQYRH